MATAKQLTPKTGHAAPTGAHQRAEFSQLADVPWVIDHRRWVKEIRS